MMSDLATAGFQGAQDVEEQVDDVQVEVDRSQDVLFRRQPLHHLLNNVIWKNLQTKLWKNVKTKLVYTEIGFVSVSLGSDRFSSAKQSDMQNLMDCDWIGLRLKCSRQCIPSRTTGFFFLLEKILRWPLNK